jgi:hypothetical protein
MTAGGAIGRSAAGTSHLVLHLRTGFGNLAGLHHLAVIAPFAPCISM